MTETWVGFDADDTLWHNESYFMESYDLFADVAAPYLADFDDPAQAAHDLLIATETVNIPAFGYGIKGATISMTATGAIHFHLVPRFHGPCWNESPARHRR